MKITPIIQYVQKLLKAVKTFYARFQLCFNLEFLSLMTKWFVYQKEFIVFLTSQVNCLNNLYCISIFLLIRLSLWQIRIVTSTSVGVSANEGRAQ